MNPSTITPSSIRAGRATQMYIEGISIPRIKYAGRWVSVNSMAVYSQEASAASVISKLDVENFTERYALLRNPPPLSFIDLALRARGLC